MEFGVDVEKETLEVTQYVNKVLMCHVEFTVERSHIEREVLQPKRKSSFGSRVRGLAEDVSLALTKQEPD